MDNNKDDRNFGDFLSGLKACMGAIKPFTLILDDPVSNSYLQNLYAPDEDPNMTIEEYERSFDQNEELGLNDIVLEGYDKEAEGTA
jgi:zinc finger protein